MVAKYIVKLEFNDTPNMVLVKNTPGYKPGSIVPCAFKPFNWKYEIAYFANKAEAINAMAEAKKYSAINGVPVFLEVLE